MPRLRPGHTQLQRADSFRRQLDRSAVPLPGMWESPVYFQRLPMVRLGRVDRARTAHSVRAEDRKMVSLAWGSRAFMERSSGSRKRLCASAFPTPNCEL
jgi:hypothetical protein